MIVPYEVHYTHLIIRGKSLDLLPHRTTRKVASVITFHNLHSSIDRFETLLACDSEQVVSDGEWQREAARECIQERM